MKQSVPVIAVTVCLLLGAAHPGPACTSFMVTKGASADGSVMITYTCDGRFHPHLGYTPAADFTPEELFEIKNWSGELLGTIPQVPHTYATVHLMNEHQLVIGESTFDGRKELQNPDGLLHYWTLMKLALQRARTAREAIDVITGLVARHGYRSTGESFTIADPDEVWIMEMIGPGPGGTGAIWVAQRVPDGSVCCHANLSRIRQFPLEDPENCRYSENVIPFAVEKGYYDPESGRPFSFSEAYCPPTPQKLRYTASRVWSIFRRCAPSMDWPSGFHRAVPGAEPYPLWITPDRKLSIEDVFTIMRDHYEGTDYDMTAGVDAGPYGNPTRCRPMTFTVDGAECTWERPISTHHTGFSIVSQSRSWLPDPVGGVLWYGVDDTYTTCYVPLYCGIEHIPPSFTKGTMKRFSWDSAWWVFNIVANYANLKYSYMIEDIREVQTSMEQQAISLQPAVDKAAVELHRQDPSLAVKYLTSTSIGHAETVVEAWRDLAERLFTKYNDGYVQKDEGGADEVGYPDAWLKDVHTLRPDQFDLPRWDDGELETELPY